MTIALAFLVSRLRHQVIAIRTERSFQRLMRYVKFDPDQPRDELGRWQETGEQEDSRQSDEGRRHQPHACRRAGPKCT